MKSNENFNLFYILNIIDMNEDEKLFFFFNFVSNFFILNNRFLRINKDAKVSRALGITNNVISYRLKLFLKDT